MSRIDWKALEADWLAGTPRKVLQWRHGIRKDALDQQVRCWKAAGLTQASRNAARIAAVKADYLAGMSRRDIGRKHNMAEQTVTYWVRIYWPDERRRPPPRRWTAADDAEMRRLFHEGLLVAQIAKRMGREANYVKAKLGRAGLTRTQGEVRALMHPHLPALRARMRELFREGLLNSEIAAIVGKDATRVGQWLRRDGLTRTQSEVRNIMWSRQEYRHRTLAAIRGEARAAMQEGA